jgi:hypothetical protein
MYQAMRCTTYISLSLSYTTRPGLGARARGRRGSLPKPRSQGQMDTGAQPLDQRGKESEVKGAHCVLDEEEVGDGVQHMLRARGHGAHEQCLIRVIRVMRVRVVPKSEARVRE